MEFEAYACAFLCRGGRWLVMRRSEGRRFAPGFWAAVGGHLEAGELNDPRAACLREVFEETGIAAERVYSLALRYILLRREADVIRQIYVYFGETDAEDVAETDEGTLHFLTMAELRGLRFTGSFAAMLAHYDETPSGHVVIGAAGVEDGRVTMAWSNLEGFDGH